MAEENSDKKKLDPINIYCGGKVQFFRKKHKYNQEELASGISLTRTSIVNIEKGRQSLTLPILLKICAILKCSPNDILPPVPEVNIERKEVVKRVVKVKANILKTSFKNIF